jgi:hypothetical protein
MIQMIGQILTMLLFAGGLIAVFGYFIFAGQKRKERKAELVETVLLPALSEVFDNPYYNENEHISADVVRGSKMVGGWSRISGGDYICGWHNGLMVQMSDLLLSHTETHTRTRTNSEGRTETYTETVTVIDFSGQWVICKFDKRVSAQLTLRAAGLPRSGFLRTLFRRASSVEMDNTVFNDMYTVLTDNPHDAFYVLTPHMMERVMAANQRAGGRLSLEYQPWGELHLAIGTGKNFFEPQNIRKSMDYTQEHSKVMNELRFIVDLVNQLRLEEVAYN